MHPDFELTDTAPDTVIEVLGMVGNPQYGTRLSEKRQYYQANRVPRIEWTPGVQQLSELRLPVGTAPSLLP